MSAAGSDLIALIRAIALETYRNMHPESQGLGMDGEIAQGSWNPKAATVDVNVSCTGALIDDTPEQGLTLYHVPLLTHATGHQAPPVGGERVHLIPTHSGWGAILWAAEDDSLGAQSGEHWQVTYTDPVHRTGESHMKMLKTGDIQRHANASIADSANTIGLTATSSASVIAPTIGLGPAGTQYAVVRVTDLQTLVTYIASHTHSSSGTGPPTSAPPTATGSSNVNAS